jgi:hypothetical protein
MVERGRREKEGEEIEREIKVRAEIREIEDEIKMVKARYREKAREKRGEEGRARSEDHH